VVNSSYMNGREYPPVSFKAPIRVVLATTTLLRLITPGRGAALAFVELGGTGKAAASGRCRRGSRGFLGHVRGISGREALPPACATPLEDGAASPGAHALAEAVGLGALAGVGLIGALHAVGSIEQRWP
jgi:hypothetical protein